MAFTTIWRMFQWEEGCFLFANQRDRRLIVRRFENFDESEDYLAILNRLEEEVAREEEGLELGDEDPLA